MNSLTCRNKSSTIAEMAVQCCTSWSFAFEWGNISLTHCFSSVAANEYVIHSRNAMGFIFADRTSLTSNTLTLFAAKTAEFVKITRNNGHYVVQAHSRSPTSVQIEGPYATSYVWVIGLVTFLLHRFRDVANYWSNFRCRQVGCRSNALIRGDPLNWGLRNLVSRN